MLVGQGAPSGRFVGDVREIQGTFGYGGGGGPNPANSGLAGGGGTFVFIGDQLTAEAILCVAGTINFFVISGAIN